MAREDVRFRSAGVDCAGWLYRPEGAGGDRPCVVLAHGFGGVKEGRLDAYAERFAAAGYVALVFDYRGFGASAGTPRQTVSMADQLEDYRAAMAAAARLPGVDPRRIVLWGVSLAGGHVLLEDVLVIGMGDNPLAGPAKEAEDTGKGAKGTDSPANFLVTVAVSPQQATRLVHGAATGTLYAALRGAGAKVDGKSSVSDLNLFAGFGDSL